MIDKLSYTDIQMISTDLKKQTDIIESLIADKELPELDDFIATVEGYSKFLENTIQINKDADAALEDLKRTIKGH